MEVGTVHNCLYLLIKSMPLGMGDGRASSGGYARVPVDMCASPSCLCWGESLRGQAAGRKVALPAEQAKRKQQATAPLQLQITQHTSTSCFCWDPMVERAAGGCVGSERESCASRGTCFWCRIASSTLKDK